jgi:rhamnopyranosyl-N-acetylglucosaminyl-diphospho-decaprenol beta-1,3/1,4-galactofuranosyltransferase
MSQTFETEGANGSVAAVLVTYNRKELLIQCINALFHQTRPIDAVVVIDNASTDGTQERLREEGYLNNPIMTYIQMPTNTGGAGGFHEGVERAYAAGYEWLWLMDDDVEPTRDALKTVLSYSGISKCIQAARMYEDNQIHRWDKWVNIEKSGRRSALKDQADRDYAVVQVGCFEGMLIHREVVSKIGFPDERFFLGGDDTAYGYLASRQTSLIYIRKPCFIKKIIKSGPSNQSLFARILDRFEASRPSGFYFRAIRNELLLGKYTSNEIQPTYFYLRILGGLLALSGTTLICERNLQNFVALWKGAFEGLRLQIRPNAATQRGASVDRNPTAGNCAP